jgi:hypothetical protein
MNQNPADLGIVGESQFQGFDIIILFIHQTKQSIGPYRNVIDVHAEAR